MPAAKLQIALKQYLRDLLDADAEQRLRAPSHRSVYVGGAPGKDGDPLEADLELISDHLGDARERLARRDLAHVSETVDQLMRQHAIPDEHRAALSVGVLQADVRLLEKMRERVLGRDLGVFSEASGDTTGSTLPATPPLPVGPLLSELLPGYVEYSVKQRDWRGQTRAQNEKTFAMFIEWSGDRPANAYARTDTTSFYDMLQKLPSLYGKDQRWRGLSLKNVIEKSAAAQVERLTMKTIKRHFSALGGFFRYSIKRGEYEGLNPAHGFDFPTKARNKGRRARSYWHGSTLVRLFHSPVWTGSHPYFRSKPGKEIIRDDKFWLPILGLFHGNRLEEFAQLRREDVQQEGAISFFNITDEGERKVKNEQSIRRVPVHPTVLKLGFLSYVDEIAPNGTDLVFPCLNPGGPDKKLGYFFTKWWSAYRKSIGLYERGLDYHSFRHGVTTKLFAAGVDRTLVDELTGHEGEGTSQTVYYHGSPLSTLHAAISKVDWPEVDFSHLYQKE